MSLFVVIALLNGVVSTLNRMVNFQAKKALGTVNGILINYLEGTVLSLVFLLLWQAFHPGLFSGWESVPPIFLTGGFFGLFSMVLILNGMINSRISHATVVVLVGQLGTGFLIDSVTSREFVPVKLAGLLLVITGVVLDGEVTRHAAIKTKSE